MLRSTHARSSDAAPPPRPRRLVVLALALAHVAGWLPLSCALPTRQSGDDTPPHSWGKLVGLMVGGFAAATFVALAVRAVLHWALVARVTLTASCTRPVRRSTSGPPPLPCVPEEVEPLEASLLVHVQELPTSPPQRAPSRRDGMMAVLISSTDAPSMLLPR